LRVVDALFVRTAKDAVNHDDGAHVMASEKLDDFAELGGVVAYVAAFREPALQRIPAGALRGDNAHGNFGRASVVGPIQSNRADGIVSETCLGFLLQPFLRLRSQLHRRHRRTARPSRRALHKFAGSGGGSGRLFHKSLSVYDIEGKYLFALLR